jgi:hypothetical protein
MAPGAPRRRLVGDERLSVRVTVLAALVGPCGALLPSIGAELPSIRRRAPLDLALAV